MGGVISPFAGGALFPPVNLQSTAALPVFGAGTVGDTNNRVELDADGHIRFGSGAGATDTQLFRAAANILQTPAQFNLANSFLDIQTAGQGIRVKEGANAKQGIAVLAAGTVVVANTSVTANSRIMLTCQALGTVVSPSALCVSAIVAGTSFTILASQNTDTSTIAYEIFEPG